MKSATASETRIPPRLFGMVAHGGERVRIGKRTGEAVYLIGEEDFQLLEALEARADLREAEEALREMEESGEKPIPWDKARKELGL